MLTRAIAVAATMLLSVQVSAQEPLAMREMGSFHVGGRKVEISGQPVKEIVRVAGGPASKLDLNGTYHVEHMYAQYFLVQNRKGKWPILMWHGGGLTGATYETTPDGREGWRDLMIRKGWDVYITDATERGRSGFASPLIWKDDPVFLTETDPWERFRIGTGLGSFDKDPAKRKLLPGNRFPIEAYDNFLKQIVPRWLSTDKAIIDAYVALIDKVCPCVILAHSQGGHFAFRAAEQRADKVKALVNVEPATSGGIDGAGKLKGVPLLLVYGDYIEQDPRWVAYRKAALAYADSLKAAGGEADVVNLPEQGIKGNSHMMMMDKNSAEVLDVISKWLAAKGLTGAA
jgi:pimeloyl-ACP methyl ester carboxylesterase